MIDVHQPWTSWQAKAARRSAPAGMCAVAVVFILALGPRPLLSQDAPTARRGSIAHVSWMTGCWRADGVEEFWTDGTGGQMFGVNRSLRNGRAVRWEFLRIYEGRTKLIYAAAPSHQPPAEFEGPIPTGDSVTFRKEEHDFPTSLTYRLAPGDSLIATVSGPGNDGASRSFDIRFGRVSCDGLRQ